MEHGSVVYVHRVHCPACGLMFAGYLDNLGDGNGAVNCPKCETKVVWKLPQHYVEQVPLPGHENPEHHHMRTSHHPGLYTRPKSSPRLDLKDLGRIAYQPMKAFESLYSSTDMQRGLSVVLVFSLASAAAGTLATAGTGQLFGFDTKDALLLGLRGLASWIVTLLAFLVFAVVSSIVAKGLYGGRGERSATITLVGYCFPAYVLVNILVLAIFATGFQGLDLTDVTSWTSSQIDQVLLAVVALIATVLIGLMWLLWIVSRAIAVANDISGSEGILTAVISAIAAGFVFLVAGAAFRLPIGLSL